MKNLAWWHGLLGVELSPFSHRERLVSALGAGIGLCVVYAVSRAVVGEQGAPLVAAPMGATAVLLFAVPHGSLSQPWPVFAGNLLSAVIGVACQMTVPSEWLAAALAVGLAVIVMHYLRCLHPPGGATALLAVIGGAPIHSLGFAYVLAPVLLNVGAILIAATAYNALFPWRRYPAALMRREPPPAPAAAATPAVISHEDFVYALTQLDSFIDVSEEDLVRIYALATGRHAEPAENDAAR